MHGSRGARVLFFSSIMRIVTTRELNLADVVTVRNPKLFTLNLNLYP